MFVCGSVTFKNSRDRKFKMRQIYKEFNNKVRITIEEGIIVYEGKMLSEVY